MKRVAWILLTAALCAGSTLAQQQPSRDDATGRKLGIAGVYHNGRIMIRWGTGNPTVWRLIKESGITLEKYDADGASEVVGGGPLRVYSDDRWQAMADTFPTAAQIVTLLRDDPSQTQGLSDLARNDIEQNKLTGLLLITEFSFSAAQGLAMAYLDENIESDKIYRYRVLLRDPYVGDTLSAECFIDTEQEIPVPPVTGLRSAAFDSYVALSWRRSLGHAGYHVEKRSAGSSTWFRATQHPILFPAQYTEEYLYRDSIPNYDMMEYRVYAFDGFQRRSEPTAVVKTYARDRTPPEPPFDIIG